MIYYRLGQNLLIINKYAVCSRYSLWPIQLVKDWRTSTLYTLEPRWCDLFRRICVHLSVLLVLVLTRILFVLNVNSSQKCVHLFIIALLVLIKVLCALVCVLCVLQFSIILFLFIKDLFTNRCSLITRTFKYSFILIYMDKSMLS